MRTVSGNGNGNGRRFDDGPREPAPFNGFIGHADERDMRALRRVVQAEARHNRLFREQVRSHLQRAEARTLALLTHLSISDPVPGPPLPLGVDDQEEPTPPPPEPEPWLRRRPTNALLLAAAAFVGLLAALAPIAYHHH